MKRVDTIARVRRAFYGLGWSMKKIMRELHVCRNTARKILRTDKTDFSYPCGWTTSAEHCSIEGN